MNSYIYVYSNETGKQVDAIEAATPEECLALATEKWNTNDFHFSSRNVEISNAI
jgi:rubredoxin